MARRIDQLAMVRRTSGRHLASTNTTEAGHLMSLWLSSPKSKNKAREARPKKKKQKKKARKKTKNVTDERARKKKEKKYAQHP